MATSPGFHFLDAIDAEEMGYEICQYKKHHLTVPSEIFVMGIN